MAIELYGLKISPPSRVVMNVLRHLGLEYQLNEVNVLAGEQHDPEFLKINPQHCIPTLVDGECVLWESRAIIQYLANKYDSEGTLYPVEPEARARVDQKLFFDMALHRIVREYYFAKFMNLPAEDPEKFAVLEQWIEFLEVALEDQTFVAASEEVTIADFVLVVTMTICHVGEFPLENYPNVLKWFDMCRETVPATQLDDEMTDFIKEIINCGGDPATTTEEQPPAEGEATEEEEAPPPESADIE